MSATGLRAPGHNAGLQSRKQSAAVHRQNSRARIVDLAWELVSCALLMWSAKSGSYPLSLSKTVQAARGSFMGGSADLDIVTGRHVPKSTMLKERRSEQEASQHMERLRAAQVLHCL